MTDVQKVILSIFKEVAKVCDNHNVPYYAIGGTCIGAVRHKGFIPWDDDLDIAIPIEHFEEFVGIARKELPSHLYVYTSDDVKHYHYVWMKVCDKRTTFIEKSEYKLKDAYKGIFIDVMPISGLPSQQNGRAEFIRKIKLYEKLNDRLRFSNCFLTIKSFIGRLPFRILSKILPYNYFSKKYLNYLKSYPFRDSSYTGYVWYSQWIERLIFPTSFFGEGVKLNFEDTLINCPSKYHKYLTQQFGDYMIPPSINEQEIHAGLIDINKPYTDFVKTGIEYKTE